MAKRKRNESQTNQYDKVFRENMEAALPGLIEHLLGLNIVHSEELPDDMQHTKERRPDLLRKITDSNGKTYVLHIEYQTKNDMDMAYRMAEYSIMLQWKYRMDVKQYVIFIGMGKFRMPQKIVSENFQFSYRILSVSSIDYKVFLKSDKPEEKIMAILANFENDNAVSAIKTILQELKSVAGSDLVEDRYFNQLRMLVQLRNLKAQFNEAMETITKFFKEERDPLFRRGELKGELKGEIKGREQQKIETVLNLKKSGFEISVIANVMGLTAVRLKR